MILPPLDDSMANCSAARRDAARTSGSISTCSGIIVYEPLCRQAKRGNWLAVNQQRRKSANRANRRVAAEPIVEIGYNVQIQSQAARLNENFFHDFPVRW